MNNKQLIDALIKAAYDSGYYSGKREDGQPHHLEAIEERGRLRDEALQRLAAVPDLLAALEAALPIMEERVITLQRLSMKDTKAQSGIQRMAREAEQAIEQARAVMRVLPVGQTGGEAK